MMFKALLLIAGFFLCKCSAVQLGHCTVGKIQQSVLMCSREVVMSIRANKDLNCRSEYDKHAPVCLKALLAPCFNATADGKYDILVDELVAATMKSFSSEKFCLARIFTTTPKNCSADFVKTFGTCSMAFQNHLVASPHDKKLCSSYQRLSTCVNETAYEFCGLMYVERYMLQMGEFIKESNNPFCTIQQLADGDNFAAAAAQRTVISMLMSLPMFIALFSLI